MNNKMSQSCRHKGNTAVSSVYIVLCADRARDQFKARVNEVAYIKADNKVSQSVRVSVGGGRVE